MYAVPLVRLPALAPVCERAPSGRASMLRGAGEVHQGRRQAAADARPHPQAAETDTVKVGEEYTEEEYSEEEYMGKE